MHSEKHNQTRVNPNLSGLVVLPSDATVHSCDTVPLTRGERGGDDAKNMLEVLATLSRLDTGESLQLLTM